GLRSTEHGRGDFGGRHGGPVLLFMAGASRAISACGDPVLCRPSGTHHAQLPDLWPALAGGFAGRPFIATVTRRAAARARGAVVGRSRIAGSVAAWRRRGYFACRPGWIGAQRGTGHL